MPRIIETTASGSPIPNSLTQSRRFQTVNPVQPNSLLRLGENNFAVYSGTIFGDVSVPTTISLINISDMGERDSIVKIQPYYARPVSTAVDSALGIVIQINGVEIYKTQSKDGASRRVDRDGSIELYIPRESKLEIFSLNTTNNNTQERGANLIGAYI